MFSCGYYNFFQQSKIFLILRHTDITNEIKNKMDLGLFKFGGYVDLGLFKTKVATCN